MPNFTISPTTGAGGYLATEVAVTPSSQNLTNNDRTTIATVTGGGASKQVTIKHFGIPSLELVSGSTSVPAAGDTLKYVINTHYPFCFKNKPAWITITDSNGANYVADTEYAATLAEGTHFNFAIGANTGTTIRESTGFYMGHYYPAVSGTLSSTYTWPISISQAAGATAYLNTSPSDIKYDWDDSGVTKTITVQASPDISWTATSQNSSFVIVGSSTGTGSGTITVEVPDINPTSTNKKTGSISVVGANITATTTLQQYRQPTITSLNGSGEINIPDTGGSININIRTDYNWWFEQKSGQHQDPSFSTTYMTLTDNGVTITPPMNSSSPALALPDGKTYQVTWTSNNGQPRNDSLNVKYVKLNGTTGDAATNISRVHQDYIVVPRITVDTDNLIFDWWEDTGTTRSFYVSTNQSAWTYSVGHNFGEFTFTKDGYYLRVSPNNSFPSTTQGVALRYATITFSADTATTTATTTQFRRPSVNPVTGTVRDIAASGATKEMLITSDYNWWLTTEFQTNTYLTVEKADTQVDVFNSNSPYGPVSNESFDFIWAENNSADNRPINGQGCFYMRYLDRSGNTRTDGGSDCGWRQSGSTTPVADDISLSSSGKSIYSGSSILNSVTVTSTDNWYITFSPDWITWNTTAGTAGNTTTLWSAGANSGSSRTGTTVFECGTASTTYTVEQDAAYVPPTPTWVASPDTFEEPSTTSPTLYADITAATAWYVQKSGDFDASWVHILQPTSTMNAGTYQMAFYIEQNGSGAPRSAVITVYAINGDPKLYIYIDQDYP